MATDTFYADRAREVIQRTEDAWGGTDPDVVDAMDDADREQFLERQRTRLMRIQELERAYKDVIRAELNHGGTDAVLSVLVREHPTLLGQLLNTVLDAIAVHGNDGRFSAKVQEVARTVRNPYI